MSQPESPSESPINSITKALGLESIGKWLSLESFKNIVPSLKQAINIAKKDPKDGFIDKVGIFLTAFSNEMERLNGEKKQVTTDTTKKVKEALAENEGKAKKSPAEKVTVSKSKPKIAPVSDASHENPSEVDPNEKFVAGQDDFGNPVILRQSAMRAFEQSKEIAKGKRVKLKVTYSYRDVESQRKIYARGTKKYGKNVNIWVARPGGTQTIIPAVP